MDRSIDRQTQSHSFTLYLIVTLYFYILTYYSSSNLIGCSCSGNIIVSGDNRISKFRFISNLIEIPNKSIFHTSVCLYGIHLRTHRCMCSCVCVCEGKKESELYKNRWTTIHSKWIALHWICVCVPFCKLQILSFTRYFSLFLFLYSFSRPHFYVYFALIYLFLYSGNSV